VRYPHWRFGMEFDHLSKSHIYGLSQIYEMVINNNPAYAYLLEGNSMVDQKMVMAHVLGHVDFFKNNYYFSKTNRKMMDSMANHATRIRRHIERYGLDKVEGFIDVCLSLDNLIDPMSPFIVRHETAARRERAAARRGAAPARQVLHGEVHQPARLHRRARRKLQEEREKPKRNPPEPERDVCFSCCKTRRSNPGSATSSKSCATRPTTSRPSARPRS
jgi:stage V sporulation protein R